MQPSPGYTLPRFKPVLASCYACGLSPSDRSSLPLPPCLAPSLMNKTCRYNRKAPCFLSPLLCPPFQEINITLGLLCSLPIPIGGHVGCFQIFLVTNNAAINILLVPLYIWARISLGFYTSNWNCQVQQ